MKKFLAMVVIGAALVGVGSVAYANVCAFDPVPAATLLWPFVVYDYNNPVNGTNTIFSVTNVSAEAQIVHFTLWTDMSVAVLDWNVVLSGYDVVAMNIRDIIGLGSAYGYLPRTGTEAYNPACDATTCTHPNGRPVDGGPVSGDIRAPWLHYTGAPAFPAGPPNWGLPLGQGVSALAGRCPASAYPDYDQIDNSYRLLFQGLLQESQLATKGFHDCTLGAATGAFPGSWWVNRDETEPTWMYITADVVWQCNKEFPDDPVTYWTIAPVGQLMFDNVLMGDVAWVNNDMQYSEADLAVHIEADQDIADVATLTAALNPITFYHRYNGTGVDGREGLPTAWAFRTYGDFDQGLQSDVVATYVRAWKGPTLAESLDGLDFRYIGGVLRANLCYPYTYYAWDMDEDVTTTPGNPWSGGDVTIDYPNLLPLETQEVAATEFRTPDTDGWMLFVFPRSNYPPAAAGLFTYPATWDPGDYYHTWMGVKYVTNLPNGVRYSAAHNALVMANYNCFQNQTLPWLGINFNYVSTLTWNGYTDTDNGFPKF